MLRPEIENCHLRAQANGDHSGMGHRSKKTVAMPKFFAWLSQNRAIEFAIFFRHRFFRIGGKIIPEMLEINPFTPCHQRQRRLAIEMEMPEIAQEKDVVP